MPHPDEDGRKASAWFWSGRTLSGEHYVENRLFEAETCAAYVLRDEEIEKEDSDG